MTRSNRLVRWLAGASAACLLSLGGVAAHADAGSLHGKYTDLKQQLPKQLLRPADAHRLHRDRQLAAG